MTQKQYRNALAALGLSQAGAAEFFGISTRSSHGYANGDRIPKTIAMLLHLMIEMKLNPNDVK